MTAPARPAPSQKTFLTAEWRHLVMLNYELDPQVLRPRVPRGTELDTWGGRTFVSVIAFRFLDTRVRGWAIPFHRDFDEINLRFYVRRRGPEGWRRGVVFIREIVPRFAIAAVARLVYNENYIALPTRNRVDLTPGRMQAEYGWQFQGRWNGLKFLAQGSPRELVAGSLEEFITEHYWGYAAQKDGGCMEYQVEHPRWQVWQATEATLDCDVAALYGTEFKAALTGPPANAFLADGSKVSVYDGVRL